MGAGLRWHGQQRDRQLICVSGPRNTQPLLDTGYLRSRRIIGGPARNSKPSPLQTESNDMTEKGIEVFQDLHLRSHSSAKSTREDILAQVREPWLHETEKEEELKESAGADEDLIVLVRSSFDDIDESALVLWQQGEDYWVSNIVPRNVGELGIARYNAILKDFVAHIAQPASQAGRFAIEQTSPSQTLDDWLDREPADALRRFSRLANKSTGAAHPMDRERWYAFLIAAHRTAKQPDSSQLVRWLDEVEGWSEDKAQELALDYEFALGLLEQYDKRS